MRFIGRRFIITLAILAAVYGEKVIAVFFPRDDREFSVFFYRFNSVVLHDLFSINRLDQ